MAAVVNSLLHHTFCNSKHLSRSVLTLVARMSHKKEHVDLTSDQYRDPCATPAQVVCITPLSSTVKGLTLQVDTNSDIQFLPGQWLDLFIQGMEKVGGFSMCSTPTDLNTNRTLDLAIKYSTWPPAYWVHTQCKVGDVVTIRFGGDFYYPTEGLVEEHNLLLVAGGVGINPLYSIWSHAANLARSSTLSPASVSLLYSAATTSELIFSSNIDMVAGEMNQFSCKFFVTQEKQHTKGQARRICREDLEKELLKMSGTRTICYLCGPPSMVEEVKGWLEELCVDGKDIKYELWW